MRLLLLLSAFLTALVGLGVPARAAAIPAAVSASAGTAIARVATAIAARPAVEETALDSVNPGGLVPRPALARTVALYADRLLI